VSGASNTLPGHIPSTIFMYSILDPPGQLGAPPLGITRDAAVGER
jgi:hypothetical protein